MIGPSEIYDPLTLLCSLVFPETSKCVTGLLNNAYRLEFCNTKLRDLKIVSARSNENQFHFDVSYEYDNSKFQDSDRILIIISS